VSDFIYYIILKFYFILYKSFFNVMNKLVYYYFLKKIKNIVIKITLSPLLKIVKAVVVLIKPFVITLFSKIEFNVSRKSQMLVYITR
jgi:hypothetical protein